MFRRRPFRRRPFRRPPPRPGAPLPPVAPRVREALRRAHQALDRGDTAAAARIFHRLAEEAARRGMGLRAARATMEAAHAEALGGKARKAVEHANQSFRVFVQAGRPGQIAPAAERVAAALRRQGHEVEAAEVEQKLEEALQEAGTTRREVMARLEATRAQRRGQLPAKCPSCGGPLIPDEAEWSDASTAVCPYCGSPVKTT